MNDKERLQKMKELKELYYKETTVPDYVKGDMDWLINRAERVEVFEEKIKLERRMNKDLHKLVKFLQENPRLAQDKFGEPVSLVAISAMDLLKKENKQAMTRVHELASVAIDQEKEYKDLQEEKRLAEEECERYKKMFSKEKGKSITLYNQNEEYEQALEFGIKYLQGSDIGQVQIVVQAMKEALGE